MIIFMTYTATVHQYSTRLYDTIHRLLKLRMLCFHTKIYKWHQLSSNFRSNHTWFRKYAHRVLKTIELSGNHGNRKLS